MNIMSKKYRIGIIGLGVMGQKYLNALTASLRWELVWVCDLSHDLLNEVNRHHPKVKTTDVCQQLFDDESLDVIGIFTLADIRPGFIRQALAVGKHIICEKPLAASVPEEKAVLAELANSDRFVAVNMFNRNAWYHEEIQQFIQSGEIGSPAIITINHQNAGMMPTEGHGPEGAPFHDCGMHYVDVARWYASSEYGQWHAQGVKMWSWPEPWWLTVHGTFVNGIVFNITQGFVYGQLAETRINHCGIEVIGTLGVVRMEHDFHEVSIRYHGINHTSHKTGPYGDKKIDVLCERFAQSLDAGKNIGCPTPHDSVIASEVSQAMLDSAAQHAPMIGTQAEMQRILKFRK
jgi:predicted dehydrogenase